MRVLEGNQNLRVDCTISSELQNQGKNCRSTYHRGAECTNRVLGKERVQSRCNGIKKFEEEKLQLNLQVDKRGIFECRGRVQGDFPVYLPDGDIFTEKLVAHAHVETLHGGVGLTMTKVRQTYWIPRLRSLTKRVIRRCHGCKRFQVSAFADPPTGNLPRERTTGSTPFKVIGVDYAGPIKYLSKTKKEKKACVALYACSLTRAVYLDLLPNQSVEKELYVNLGTIIINSIDDN